MAFEELTRRHATIWSSAPFENIAELISDMHLALVERLAPERGEHWLDLACGAGDVAFHAAQAGAVVTASDLSPTLVEAAQRRAKEHGLDLTLEVADCQDLHYPDASFDVVSSLVGVIFAPDHERVAQELARVCRPGGRIGLTAWRKQSGIGEMFGVMSPFMPTPPPGAGSPFQWGDEAYVESMLGDAFRSSSTSSTPATRASTPARCGRSSATTTGLRSPSGRPSTKRAGPSSTGRWRSTSSGTAQKTGSASSAATSSSEECGRPKDPRQPTSSRVFLRVTSRNPARVPSHESFRAACRPMR